ncbi:MAG TPA: TIGR00730 family Rossman fold protein [Bacteroidales bacterium]
MTICVFASSSSRIDSEYGVAATSLGKLLAQAGIDVVYGGGGIGLMGRLADSVLANGGKITGVIPGFMKEEGWDHPSVSEMIITSDMGERKKQMFQLADAVVALPGGVGTLEELTEAMTLKQLGLYQGPIIILNTLNFYKSFIEFLEHMVSGNFLRYEHKGMWEIAGTVEEVMVLLNKKDGWHHDPRSIARI